MLDEDGNFTQEFIDFVASAPGISRKEAIELLEKIKAVTEKSDAINARKEQDAELNGEEPEVSEKSVDLSAENISRNIEPALTVVGQEYEDLIKQAGHEAYVVDFTRDWAVGLHDQISQMVELPLQSEQVYNDLLNDLDQIQLNEADISTLPAELDKFKNDFGANLDETTQQIIIDEVDGFKTGFDEYQDANDLDWGQNPENDVENNLNQDAGVEIPAQPGTVAPVSPGIAP